MAPAEVKFMDHLRTPIASELQMTEEQAGQAIAISGMFTVLTICIFSFATVLWPTARDRRT
jgi:predicted MFS family arabinose efflux permease